MPFEKGHSFFRGGERGWFKKGHKLNLGIKLSKEHKEKLKQAKIKNPVRYWLGKKTCKRCNQRGKKLNPHHIQNFNKFIESRYAIDNGITLCISCHLLFHQIYGKKNNNREQIVQFLNY